MRPSACWRPYEHLPRHGSAGELVVGRLSGRVLAYVDYGDGEYADITFFNVDDWPRSYPGRTLDRQADIRSAPQFPPFVINRPAVAPVFFEVDMTSPNHPDTVAEPPKRFTVTAMKYPGFFAKQEFEAASFDDAIAKAKAHDWDREPFEATSEWPPVQSLLLETDDDERLIDLEPSGVDAIAVLREFVEDVKRAHGRGDGEAINAAGLDWPDLAVTYRKAVAVLKCRPA